MEMEERNELAEQLDIIGRLLAIDGVGDLLYKIDNSAGLIKINGVVIQIVSKGLKADKQLMDKLACMHTGNTLEEVKALDDKEYSKILRSAIMQDVLGFFG